MRIRKTQKTVIKTLTFGFILGAIMSFTRMSSVDCPIDPLIKQNYTIDAQLMFMESGTLTNINSSDSVLVPIAETNSYLRLLSAVSKVNDTIFKKLKIKHHNDKETFIVIDLDPSKPWVKTFIKTRGQIINNKQFIALVSKYGLSINQVGNEYIYCYSDKIIMQYPGLHNELIKIPGLKGVGNSVAEGKLPTIRYDKSSRVLTIRQYKNGVSSYPFNEAKVAHEWVYEISDCQAKLISVK